MNLIKDIILLARSPPALCQLFYQNKLKGVIMKISDLLKVIDADATVLTQRFFQECAYVRKKGEIFPFDDVEVKRLTAIAYYSEFDVRNGRAADTYYLHID